MAPLDGRRDGGGPKADPVGPCVEGLRLIATAIDWYDGTGPEFHGPDAALILAGCGRQALDDQLTGDGLEVRAER